MILATLAASLFWGHTHKLVFLHFELYQLKWHSSGKSSFSEASVRINFFLLQFRKWSFSSNPQFSTPNSQLPKVFIKMQLKFLPLKSLSGRQIPKIHWGHISPSTLSFFVGKACAWHIVGLHSMAIECMSTRFPSYAHFPAMHLHSLQQKYLHPFC